MEHPENPMADAWGLHPILDMPELFPPVVLFCILGADPHAKYKKALDKLTEAREHGHLQHLPAVPPDTIRQWTLRSAWDSLFHEVPGDRVGFLYQPPNVAQAENPGKPLSHAVLIKSTEPPGMKWIVTRATEFRGKAVCWCVPVDVVLGQRSEVVLSSENITTLETVQVPAA